MHESFIQQWGTSCHLYCCISDDTESRIFRFDTEVKGEGGNKITEGTECDFEILSKNTPLQM